MIRVVWATPAAALLLASCASIQGGATVENVGTDIATAQAALTDAKAAVLAYAALPPCVGQPRPDCSVPQVVAQLTRATGDADRALALALANKGTIAAVVSTTAVIVKLLAPLL